jgi:hypothetical protein
MIAFLRKYSTPILFLVLITLLVLSWRFPGAGLRLGIVFLLFSLVTGNLAVIQKHKKAYQQGNITRVVFIRNVVLEILGMLLSMSLAGLLGRQAAAMATRHIDDGLIRLIAGLLVGLLAGIAIGFVVRQTWGRLVKEKG